MWSFRNRDVAGSALLLLCLALITGCASAQGTFAPIDASHPASPQAPAGKISDLGAMLAIGDAASMPEEPANPAMLALALLLRRRRARPSASHDESCPDASTSASPIWLGTIGRQAPCPPRSLSGAAGLPVTRLLTRREDHLEPRSRSSCGLAFATRFHVFGSRSCALQRLYGPCCFRPVFSPRVRRLLLKRRSGRTCPCRPSR